MSREQDRALAIARARARAAAEGGQEQGATTAAPQEGPSFGRVLGISALNAAVDTILNTPEALAQSFMRGPVEAVSAAAGALTGGAIGGRSDLTAPQERILPGGQDVRAGLRAVRDVVSGGAPGISQAFQAGLAEEQATEQRFAEEQPVAAGLGGALGEGLALATLRSPIARGARAGRLAPQPRPRQFDPGVRRQINDVLQSKSIQSLRRGLGKSVETGIEGATLSILNGGDPVEQAAFGAGGQVAGSLSLAVSGVPDLFRKRLLRGGAKLAVTAGVLTALARLAQEAGPGQNDVFSAIDTAFNKIALGLTVGTLAGLAGAGRIGGRTANNLPIIADSITALQRGAVLSGIRDLTTEQERGNQTPMRVLEMLSENPTAFTAQARRKLEKAMTDGRTSLSRTVDELMRNREFRRTFDELNQ